MLTAAVLATSLAAAPMDTLPPDAVAALRAAETAVLYSLEPWEQAEADEPKLYRFKILGQAEIEGAALESAAAEFEAAVARWGGMMAMCFDPRHALAVDIEGHHFDFLLCYACSSMAVYRDGTMLARVGADGSAKPLNALLRAANVPVSTSHDEDAERAAAAKADADLQRWQAAAPAAIAAHARIYDSFGAPSGLATVATLLNRQVPDPASRVLALYAWYGSGAGPWSGHPAYESVAEELLLRHSTAELLAPLDAPELSEPQIEGAARLLGGWAFGQQRAEDLQNLPGALKARLLAHALRSTDDDKRSRAQHAFAQDGAR